MIVEAPREPLIATPTADEIRLVAAPLPIPVAKINRLLPRGQSLAELLEFVRVPRGMVPTIEVDGHAIDRRYWRTVRPKAGRTVTIRAVPMGGGGGGAGGGDSNKGLRTALLAVVLIAAIAVTVLTYGATTPLLFGLSGAAWGMIGATAITVGGGLLINALVPVQTPRASRIEAAGNVWGITGARNAMAALGMPIPRNYGRNLMFPSYGAEPFTEVIGGEQYLRVAFCLGDGPQRISEMKIGDTPIENFTGVEIETREGWPTDAPLTLFSNDAAEDAESVRLEYAIPTIRVTRQEADELSFDLGFPEGIWAKNSRGDLEIVYTSFYVDYRRHGSSEWVPAPGRPAPHPQFPGYETPTPGVIEFREASQTPILFGWRWQVAIRGTYDLRIMKLQADREGQGGSDKAFWAALRAFKLLDPMPLKLAKVAMRIKATEQLNGVVDTFNCIVESYLPDWNGSIWTSPVVTSNPASVYRHILQGNSTADPVPDTRLELAELSAWHNECVIAGFSYNAVIDGRSTVYEQLREVAAVGRGAFSMGAFGKYSVTRDRPQTVPVAHITPRNSWNYSGRRAFPDVPHALKVRWIDPASGWQPVEAIVYDDGYDANTATKFETVEYRGITSAVQAWKLGRYLIAVARLRPEIHEVQQDFEHVIYTRGDLVRLSHDVISAGLQRGRITAVTLDGSNNATGITSDEPFPMATGTNYGVLIRTALGQELTRQVVTVDGLQKSVTFTTPIPAASRPLGGELVMFGELGSETVDVICHTITPGKDLTATCAFVPAAPAVHLADQGDIPPWVPSITKPPITQRLPPKPIIDTVRSDEDVLVLSADGSLSTRILLTLRYAAASGAPTIDTLQVQFKRSDSTVWQTLQSPVSGAATQVSVAPVEDGVAYDIRVRSISGEPAPGLASEWASVLNHLVIGKTTAPPSVAALTLEGEFLRWPYPSAPPDLAGFQIRRHFGDRASWEDAHVIGDLAATGPGPFQFPIRLEPFSIVTYLVKAVDRAGNMSAIAATLAINLGEPQTGTVLRSVDYKALAFPGTHNGLIVNGDLAAQSTTLFWGEPTLPFWSSVAGAEALGFQSMAFVWLGGFGHAITTGATTVSRFWQSKYGTLLYRFSILPTPDEVGADLIGGFAVAASTWRLEYQLTGTTRFWPAPTTLPFWPSDTSAPFWGDAPAGDTWLPFNGRIRNITRQVYEFRIIATSTVLQSKITGLLLKIDAPVITESFDDVALPLIGGRLPLTKRYRAIRTVTHGLQADGGVAATIKTIDKGIGVPFLTDGPLLQAFDVANFPTPGLVDATITGY